MLNSLDYWNVGQLTLPNLEGTPLILYNINDFENIAYRTFFCRDLGEHLHKEIKTNSRKIAEKELDALQSIVDNVHCKAYPRTLKSSSTGMTTEECYIFLSEKGMKQINEKFGNKIATKIRTMF